MDWRALLLVLLMCGLIQADKNSTIGKGGKKPGRRFIGPTVTERPWVILPSSQTQCIPGGKVNLTSPAEITSPRHRYGYYLPNSNCTWEIQAPAGHQIKLKFTSFDLETSVNCINDNVKVYNGHGPKASLLATLCGNEIPVVAASTSGFMTIEFNSNRYNGRRGFRLLATFINLKKAQCKGNVVTITRPTTIMSPSYPNNYPVNENCNWQINAPANMIIKLTFEEFDVEYVTDCVYDQLTIHDGSSKSAGMMANLCGSKTVPEEIQSNNNSMFLHFKTDLSEAGHGFKIFVSFVHPGECNGSVVHLTTPVEIFSPNYPRKYPKPVSCSWLITPQPGKSIYYLYRPTYIDLGSGRNCSAAKLQFTYGAGSNRTLSISRCYSGYQSIQQSNKNLLINFNSQSSEGKGFRMTFLTRNHQGGQGVSVCGSAQPLTSDRQYIVSPLDVQGYWFPPNTDCSMLIKAPSDKLVKLTRRYFYMAYSTNCSRNYLEILNGQSENAPSFGRLCRTFPSTGIISSGSDLRIVFHSGPGSYRGKRFQLYVQFLSKPTCGGTLGGNYGELKSPQFAGQNYLSNANCNWSINVGSNKIAYLRVNRFSLEESLGCRYDSLKVYDGRDNTSPMIGNYCGTTIPQYITGRSNFMFVQFKSDNSLSDAGFDITYAGKPAPSGSA